MCLSSCCLCSPAFFLPHCFRKPWRRPEPREETWTKHPLDCHNLLSSTHTKQKAFTANYTLKSWDLKIKTIFVKREKNGGKAPPGGTPQGLRNSATKWRRVPEGGEWGRGSEGTLCLLGATSSGKATRTWRPRIASGAARRERARSRPETHPGTEEPSPAHRQTLPLSAGHAPRSSSRVPGHLSPTGGAERAEVPPPAALRARGAGSRAGRASPEQLRWSGEGDEPVHSAELRSPRDTASGRRCPRLPEQWDSWGKDQRSWGLRAKSDEDAPSTGGSAQAGGGRAGIEGS